MKEVLELLAAPFFACLVLTGIHSYLGIHVVERGVIFVDLALAQIAALGTTVAFLFGYAFHSQQAYFFSLGFTFLGAAVFAISRRKREEIPQEAIIGITYAVAAAASILAISQAPEGAEHIKDMLVGNLLTVSWREVLKVASLYAAIGILHGIFRKPFLAISKNPQEAERQGYSIRLWDFLFYVTFGFVVTSSVEIAGVLLVFSYLIVPSVAAILFYKGIRARLLFAWSMGTIVSAAGMILSYTLDLPTGAAIVCTFGLALLLCYLVRYLVDKMRPL